MTKTAQNKEQYEAIYPGSAAECIVSPHSAKPLFVLRSDEHRLMTWGEARHFANRAVETESGSGSLRLPSTKELAAIFSRRSQIGGFNLTGDFNNGGYYWTSDTLDAGTRSGAGFSLFAIALRFNDGRVCANLTETPSSVRLVYDELIELGR